MQGIRLGPVLRPRFQVEALDIPTGVTAVLGQSGAGKTSLLDLLIGFEFVESGVIHLSDSPITDGLRLSWVPSDFGIWSHLSVRDHLRVVSPNQGIQVDRLLEQFDLENVHQQKPETLSMGERSRLAIARSLASQAAIHVMDEPFAHVDPGRIDRYWRVVREYLQQSSASLVFSSHSAQVVMREAEHVICLHSGLVTWTGSPKQLYSFPPNRVLAALLGPVNWFEKHEAWEWIRDQENWKSCVRPEELLLETDTNSPQVIERSWHVGPYQETDLRDLNSGATRTVYHQPGPRPLPAGTPVALRILLCCLLCFVLGLQNGCRVSEGNEPVLRVQELQQYLLPAEGAMLPAARSLTYSPEGDLIVLDNVGRVLQYGSDGNLTRKWWMPEYTVGRPEGVCVMQDGRLAIADTHYNRVVFFDKNCQVSGMFGEVGSEPGQFIYTSAVAQDDEGYLYVAEYGGNDRIQKFTSDGQFVLMFGAVGAEDGEFQRPSGLVWHDGVLYVADAINNRVQAFNAQGEFLRVVADAQTTGLYYPYDISLGPNHSLIVVEYGAGRMTQISIEGELLGRYGSEGRSSGDFWTPWGIAVNQSGRISVADTGNRRVVELQLKH